MDDLRGDGIGGHEERGDGGRGGAGGERGEGGGGRGRRRRGGGDGGGGEGTREHISLVGSRKRELPFMPLLHPVRGKCRLNRN